MSDGTAIEWTDATWNVVNGCSVTSPGCKHCYAMKLAGTRLKHHPSRAGLTQDSANGPIWTGETRFNEAVLLDPLRWKRPRRIFVCAHGDLFHESVPDEWIDRVFAVMALAPQHQFQVLTKRADRMREYCISRFGGWGELYLCDQIEALCGFDKDCGGEWGEPLPNVWLGVSVEDQKRADVRIPDLLATPAAVRFLSCEPLLGPVVLTDIDMGPLEAKCAEPSGLVYVDALTGIHADEENGSIEGIYGSPDPHINWVICGGESGPGARPMHPDWARSLRDQCAAAGVPFFFKQWGSWLPAIDRDLHDPDWRKDYSRHYSDHGRMRWLNLAGGRGFHGERFHVMECVGKKAAANHLDGVQHLGMPV